MLEFLITISNYNHTNAVIIFMFNFPFPKTKDNEQFKGLTKIPKIHFNELLSEGSAIIITINLC